MILKCSKIKKKLPTYKKTSKFQKTKILQNFVQKKSKVQKTLQN